MENILYKYLSSEKRIESTETQKALGPVITISRDLGCDGNEIGILLVEAINKRIPAKSGHPEWKYINKEILTKSAKELHANREKVLDFFKGEEKGYIGDIVSSFLDKDYVSDEFIKNTISEVIKGFGEEGHAVIVGRAGFINTRYIPQSLHIKLVAPFEWRVRNFAKRHNMNYVDAMDTVKEMSEERDKFLHFFRYDQNNDENFDIIFNRKTLSKHEIINAIMDVLELKKFL